MFLKEKVYLKKLTCYQWSFASNFFNNIIDCKPKSVNSTFLFNVGVIILGITGVINSVNL